MTALVEDRFEDGFEHLQHRLLNPPVDHIRSPSQTADGIASDLVLHKFFDRRDDFWRFFFDSFAAGTRFSDPLHIHIMLK